MQMTTDSVSQAIDIKSIESDYYKAVTRKVVQRKKRPLLQDSKT